VVIGERTIDLRISSLPTAYGERMVLRLLDSTNHLCDFPRLGMPELIARPFLEAARRASGIILVTGPTGSGKTTTLYSTLRQLDSRERNIMTIEDPIEYELNALGSPISQSQVNLKKGVNFETGLRHILRQDPDVIMVGEIRDAETARMAIQSSLTGHLVFSTLHTNDAVSAVTRLIDLGVEPYLVAASLSAVLAQRLVRTLCIVCTGTGSTEGVLCGVCSGSGYKGRVGVFELLVMTEAVKEIIDRRGSLDELRQAAIAQGMRTLADEGKALIAAKRTTAVEIERVING
nr:type II/IV secretion system protein [Planctomycetota bacterium]